MSPTTRSARGLGREIVDPAGQGAPARAPGAPDRAPIPAPTFRWTAGTDLPRYAAATVAVLLPLVALGVAASNTTPAALEIVRAIVVGAWAVAGFVLLRVPRRNPGAIVLGGSLLAGAATVADAVEVHRSPTSAVAELAVRIGGALAIGALFHLLLALPDGQLSSRGRRLLALAGYMVAGATGAVLVGTRSHVRTGPLFVMVALATVIGLLAGNRRYRQSTSADRHRMQWIGCALAVGASALLVVSALRLLADWPGEPSTVALAVSVVVPLALVAAFHRTLVPRVDDLFAHCIAFAGLTSLVVGVYTLVILGFGRRPTGGERSLLILSMVAAAVVAVAYPPARNRLTDVANRIAYGERTAPDETLRTFGQRMTRAIPLDELLLQLVESLRKTMRLRSAEVWTGSNGTFELTSGVPHRVAPRLEVGPKELPVVARAGISGGTWVDIWLPRLAAGRDVSCLRVAPLAHGGALLGLIVLERHPDADSITEDDDLTVTEIARQVSLALHNVQLDSALQVSLDQLREANDELRSSRARIVAAGDAERRRLERNLHDGAQQYLVAMAVKLRLAHDAVADGEDDALELLDELRRDMGDAVAELRALAHGIFPPQLMSGGLPDALTAAAARAALPTTADIRTTQRFPTELEAAVYFCVLEALQNAGKHAGDGAVAAVEVWEEATELRFSVNDNGAGFSSETDAGFGQGFVNMADRLGAHGGSLQVDTAPGRGVTVRGAIPMTAERQSDTR